MPDEARGLSPDVPASAPTSEPTPQAGAPAQPAPTVQVGDKTYTLDEVQTHLANYQQLQGNYTRASQELARARDAVEFANALEQYPDLRDRFIAEMQGAVTGQPASQPQKGPTGEMTAEQQRMAALEAKLTQLERERAMEWASGQWNNTRTKFQEVMGRAMTPQDELQVQQYLDRTGAADLWSSVLAVFEPQFRDRWGAAKTEQAQRAALAAQGNVTEGTANAAPEGPINWATASIEEQVAKGRRAAGGESDPTYNPYVDFGTERR